MFESEIRTPSSRRGKTEEEKGHTPHTLHKTMQYLPEMKRKNLSLNLSMVRKASHKKRRPPHTACMTMI